MTRPARKLDVSIWFFAFGYFASYVPYSAMTKALSNGLLDKLDGQGIAGASLLPWSTLVSLVGMIGFITIMRWWQFAGHRTIAGRSVPFPNRWTFLSGVCTAAVIVTTTLAYTFAGISIVFMMLLMRGGVLVIAPLVDAITGRRVRWFSWIGLGLSIAALMVAFLEGDHGVALSVVAIIDVSVYLASYFVRLRFMSKLAKSDDHDARLRYFVEEQMVATPVVVLTLGVLAVVGSGSFMMALRDGWTVVFERGVFIHVLAIGLFSQGTGIFGGLILLAPQENSYCVPVNRASSILAGVLASLSLGALFAKPLPPALEFVGAGLIIAAIVFLSFGPRLSRAASRT